MKPKPGGPSPRLEPVDEPREDEQGLYPVGGLDPGGPHTPAGGGRDMKPEGPYVVIHSYHSATTGGGSK